MRITFKGSSSDIMALIEAIENASKVIVKSASFDGRNTIEIEVEEIYEVEGGWTAPSAEDWNEWDCDE
jgi:hypothetical protein